jgi:hypothetical protein
MLPHMARAKLGHLEGVYGNAEPHPLAWSGGACPAGPSAPGVVSCPNRRGRRLANRWWEAGEKREGGLSTASNLLVVHAFPARP